MKRVLFAFFLMNTPLIVNAALKEGDTAPDFTAPASLAGKSTNLSLKEVLKKGPVVLYFYPSAYTNGCNLQAHNFAVNYDKFTKAGASIIGVSLDNIVRLNEFSADPEFCAGKFPVVSDDAGKISKAYDLAVREAQPGKKDTHGKDITHGFAERTTFIITSDGKIVASIGGLKGKENVDKSLEVVQHLAPHQ
ncbi:MAG: peroxiredoxin [Methylococcaceae bacterium]|nr:MAG: peroxiredoxin [Methylococcaceae bacterium]